MLTSFLGSCLVEILRESNLKSPLKSKGTGLAFPYAKACLSVCLFVYIDIPVRARDNFVIYAVSTTRVDVSEEFGEDHR